MLGGSRLVVGVGAVVGGGGDDSGGVVLLLLLPAVVVVVVMVVMLVCQMHFKNWLTRRDMRWIDWFGRHVQSLGSCHIAKLVE